MKKMWLLLPLVLLVFVWACSSDSDDSDTDDDGSPVTFDRGTMLANWADNIIMPSYSAFLTSHASFKAEFDIFKNDRSEANLVSLRQTWVDAYKSWQHISMFEIGPAEINGLRLNVNTFPTDFDLIQDHIGSGSYNFELSSNRDSKGFPALDYLLNGIAGTDAEIVAVYTNTTNGDAHITYFEDILNDIETRVSAVHDEWQNGYRDTFVTNDGSSATASVDRYVNDFIFYYEKFLRAGKMGIPLGVFTGTQAPTTLESYFRPELSNVLFQEGLNAVQDFFNGKHVGSAETGESLASYLIALNTVKNGEALDELINQQLNTARDRVSTLDAFRTEIENNNPSTNLLLAYDEVQKTVPLFKVDMVSAMSIAIDFVDADGD